MTIMRAMRRSRAAKLILGVCSLGVLSMLLLSWLPALHHQPTRTALTTQPLRVVTSIAPLHSLVSMVMAGVGEPHLLIRGQQSPHTFHLKPSDAEVLTRADLIIWIGPAVESFLAPALHDHQAITMRLDQEASLKWLPIRRGGSWLATCAHDHDHEHGHGHGHGHQNGHDDRHHHDHAHEIAPGAHSAHHTHDHNHSPHGAPNQIDGHFWLDPDRAATFVTLVTERLSRLDPIHAATYRANAQTLQNRLHALHQKIKQKLANVAQHRFLVFHDAYQYLERWSGLEAVGSVVVQHEMPLSAQHLQNLIQRAAETGAKCIFSEPQFASRQVTTLAQQMQCRSAVLDPLGTGSDTSGNNTGKQADYLQMMETLAAALIGCLDQSTKQDHP